MADASNKSLKRKHQGEDDEDELVTTNKKAASADSSNERLKCKYGSECYRKNEDHLAKYSHSPEKQTIQMSDKALAKKAAMTVLTSEDVNSQSIYLTKVHNIRTYMAVNQSHSLHLPGSNPRDQTSSLLFLSNDSKMSSGSRDTGD